MAGDIKSKPPVLLIHGDQDELIPGQALMMGSQALAALEVPVEWHISPGVGHGIDQEGLRHGGEFLATPIRPARLEPAIVAREPPIRAQLCISARFTFLSRFR